MLAYDGLDQRHKINQRHKIDQRHKIGIKFVNGID